MNGHYFYVNVGGTKPTNPSTQGFKKKSEEESVIRVRLYERRERTNFVYYIAFGYPTKSYSRRKFIACKSFYNKMLILNAKFISQSYTFKLPRFKYLHFYILFVFEMFCFFFTLRLEEC